jgi:hypothetical protein
MDSRPICAILTTRCGCQRAMEIPDVLDVLRVPLRVTWTAVVMNQPPPPTSREFVLRQYSRASGIAYYVESELD